MRIKGFHGYLRNNRAKKMDDIATVISKDFEWEFNGNVGEFAELWKDSMLVHYKDAVFTIYVSDHINFQQR